MHLIPKPYSNLLVQYSGFSCQHKQWTDKTKACCLSLVQSNWLNIVEKARDSVFLHVSRKRSNVVMGVSKNNGTSKSSTFRGFSIINHSFWGTPIFGNTLLMEEILHHLVYMTPCK